MDGRLVHACTNRDDRYFTDTCQATPLHGYPKMFEKMPGHPDSKVMLETDYREMIYKGPVNALFNPCHGPLPYRSLEFRHETYPQATVQPTGTVNYPDEYPHAEGDPYYPIPRPENAELCGRYKALADAEEGVYFVPRLASYRYCNMGQVVAQALTTHARLNGERNHAVSRASS